MTMMRMTSLVTWKTLRVTLWCLIRMTHKKWKDRNLLLGRNGYHTRLRRYCFLNPRRGKKMMPLRISLMSRDR